MSHLRNRYQQEKCSCVGNDGIAFASPERQQIIRKISVFKNINLRNRNVFEFMASMRETVSITSADLSPVVNG